MTEFAIALLQMLVLTLIAPAFLLIGISFWCWALFGFDALLRRRSNSEPWGDYCDIDPRCHPAFMWAADGNGYIGSLLVLHG